MVKDSEDKSLEWLVLLEVALPARARARSEGEGAFRCGMEPCVVAAVEPVLAVHA